MSPTITTKQTCITLFTVNSLREQKVPDSHYDGSASAHNTYYYVFVGHASRLFAKEEAPGVIQPGACLVGKELWRGLHGFLALRLCSV